MKKAVRIEQYVSYEDMVRVNNENRWIDESLKLPYNQAIQEVYFLRDVCDIKVTGKEFTTLYDVILNIETYLTRCLNMKPNYENAGKMCDVVRRFWMLNPNFISKDEGMDDLEEAFIEFLNS